MIVKVLLGTMQNAKKLVNIAEKIPCDVELCSGRYTVDAKSMLGVLSIPEFEFGELHIHTDEKNLCDSILEQLLELGLLMDTHDSVKNSLYDITSFGEILIDFTWQGKNEDGRTLFAQNPGGRSGKCGCRRFKTWRTYSLSWESGKRYTWSISSLCSGKRKCRYSWNGSG